MTVAAPTRDLRTLADAPKKLELVAALNDAGQRPLTLVGDRGETILVLPHGGRVLGLFSAESDKNFLWTSATISTGELAREHFASDCWCNSGGDRTWLAPEIDFFYPHFPDTARQYFQPRQVDPGHHAALQTDSRILLENYLTIPSFRRGWSAPLRIAKTVRKTADPLAQGSSASLAGKLEFAGYALHTTLELLSDRHDRCEIGLWNLLQLPGGGEMIVPIYRPTTPVVYFGDIPQGHLRSDDHFVRYRMSAPNEQKIGVDALAVSGRAGYVIDDADDPNLAALVVRSFSVDPSGRYVDVPLHTPDGGGHAFQACNIDADYLGRFAELEYHVPAIGGESGMLRCDDISRVWGYRGPREAIAAAAYELLGVEL